MVTRRHRRKERADLVGLVLIAISVALLVGGGVLYAVYKAKQIEIDKVTLCPVNGPSKKKVVLVDKSESFSPIEKESILLALKGNRAVSPYLRPCSSSCRIKEGSMPVWSLNDTTFSDVIYPFPPLHPKRISTSLGTAMPMHTSTVLITAAGITHDE